MTTTQSTDSLDDLRRKAKHYGAMCELGASHATIGRAWREFDQALTASLAAPQAQGVAITAEQERARKLAEDWHEGVPKADQFAWACKAAGSLLLLSAAPSAPAAPLVRHNRRMLAPDLLAAEDAAGGVFAAGALASQPVAHLDALVSRFLSWPLPDDVCSDDCATQAGYPHRTGTVLLTAQQAKQMLMHVLGRTA